MKLLLVHNFHRSHKPSGEDVVYRRERELLRTSNMEIHTYERSTDEAASFSKRDYFYLVTHLHFNERVYRDFRAELDRVQPDLVHVHNTFPLLSSAIHGACKDAGVPVIQRLPNFYLFCARGTCDRDGQPCTLCLDTGTPWHGVRYGCYSGSRLASLPMMRMIRHNWQQGYWRDTIDAFITVTEPVRDIFVEAGLPADRLFVKPNFLPDPMPEPVEPATPSEPYILFVGRLTEEKGIDVLLKAAEQVDAPIKVVGGSPDIESYKKQAQHLHHIEFLGTLPQQACFKLMRNARCLVFPSVCIETFGLTIIESFAHATPVVASRIGGPGALVDHGHTGLLFTPGDADALAQHAQTLLYDADTAARMGEAARAQFLKHYTPESNLSQLTSIYSQVLARQAREPEQAGA